jgi:parallel beta-helix repeat protein
MFFQYGKNNMKSNAKSKIIILIAVGILIALSPMITINFSLIVGNNNKESEYNDETILDNKNLKISAISGKIHIDNNWTATKSAGICTGDGTYSEPYIIEDLVIDAEGSGSCILIENSTVYFRIENCTLYNSGSGWTDAGIRLVYANKSQLIDNNCSSNYVGIQLYNSTTNTISGNTANDNYYGIYLGDSNNNTVSGNNANDNYYGIIIGYSVNNTVSENTVNNNIWEGIFLIDSNNNIISGNNANSNYRGILLENSDYNTISGNTANNNHDEGIFLIESNNNTVSVNTANNNVYGIYLWKSDYNKVSGNNFLGNDECIREDDCEGNIIENNECGIIPGYNLFFLLGTLSVAVIIMSKKLKKS